MMDPQILQTIAGKRLRHRMFIENGEITYLLKGDREAVRLDETRWRSLSAQFEADTTRATSRLKWSFTLAIPAMIATMVLIANVPVLDRATVWVDQFPGWNVAMGIVVIGWLPLLGLGYHWLAIKRANERFEQRVGDLPRVPPPDRRRPAMHQEMEILILLLVGPAVLIRAFGTVFPDAYRNTPLSGAQLGWLDLAAVVAIGVWFLTRQRFK